MALNSELLEKRNKKLIEEFKKLCSIKEKGSKVSKYSYERILEKLEERFFISQDTIQKIIKKS